jgi:CSLREA domain-containing protein
MYGMTQQEAWRRRPEEIGREVAAIRQGMPPHADRGKGLGPRVLAVTVLVAALAAFLMLAAGPSYASTTFYVNSTSDHFDANLTVPDCDTGYTVERDGGGEEAECTLRAAIEQANHTQGADTIKFAIPGTGVKTIAPQSEMPLITEALTIDGYTQPGASPNTRAVGSDAVLRIELSGASAPDVFGLGIYASNSTVRGLVVNRWKEAGIYIGPISANNKVVGNFVGTDASGTQKLGNDQGIHVYDGSNNAIGGTTAAERNVVSGNAVEGIYIYGPNATGNRIAGNYIGTGKNGTIPLGNGDSGANIDAAPNNTIGGTTTAARNVISGNEQEGITVEYGEGNRVTGNFIGTDASGTKALGNGEQGVFVGRAPNTTVGGTTAGERNVISANDAAGMLIFDASGSRVTGNFIGTAASGKGDLGNGEEGVSLTEASGTVIGGAQAGARNVISGNGGQGVLIYGNGAMGNRILSNSIFSNDGLGIDLGADGPTANDPGDVDTGANELQNKPVLSSAKKSATGTTTVRGTLDSTPERNFKVQLFSNPEGGNQGKTLLGSVTVSTNGTGDASFSFSTKKRIGLGQNITSTATGAYGTSEFSASRRVVAR